VKVCGEICDGRPSALPFIHPLPGALVALGIQPLEAVLAHKADAVRFFEPANHAFPEFGVIWRATGAGRFDAFRHREKPNEFDWIVYIGRRVGMTTPIVSSVSVTDPLLNLANDRKARQFRKKRFRNSGIFGDFNEFRQDRFAVNRMR
jgi:hypothetical protein